MNSAYRRFYLYSALSIAVLAAAIAVGSVLSLIGRFAGLGLSAPTDNDVRLTLSLAVALLLLAIPIGLVHFLLIGRGLADPAERAANVRHSYLNFWIFVALMVDLAGGTSLAALTVGLGTTGDRSIPLAAVLVASAVAVVAWRWRRATPAPGPRWELDAAFAAMVVAMFVAAVQLANAANAAGLLWRGVRTFAPPVTDADLRTSAAGVAVALIVWAVAARWIWPFRTAAMRIRYLSFAYAIGVAVLAIGAATEIAALDAAARRRGIPPITEAWPWLGIGTLLVVLHGGGLLVDRGRNGHPSRTTDRVLVGLPALVGLASLVAAAALLWTTFVDHSLVPGVARDDVRDRIGTAFGPLIVGAALYPAPWRAFLRWSDASSAVRRFTVFTIVCLALAGTVVSGAATLFNLFSLVAGATGAEVHQRSALTWSVPALLFAAIFAAHLLMYLSDQRVQKAAAPAPSGADPLVLLMEDVAAGRVSAVDAAARARTLASR